MVTPSWSSRTENAAWLSPYSDGDAECTIFCTKAGPGSASSSRRPGSPVSGFGDSLPNSIIRTVPPISGTGASRGSPGSPASPRRVSATAASLSGVMPRLQSKSRKPPEMISLPGVGRPVNLITWIFGIRRPCSVRTERCGSHGMK